MSYWPRLHALVSRFYFFSLDHLLLDSNDSYWYRWLTISRIWFLLNDFYHFLNIKITQIPQPESTILSQFSKQNKKNVMFTSLQNVIAHFYIWWLPMCHKITVLFCSFHDCSSNIMVLMNFIFLTIPFSSFILKWPLL